MQFQTLAPLALLLASTSSTHALPNPTTHLPARQPIPLTTTITYYQGNLNPSAACSSPALAVAHGNITAGTCYAAHTYGIALQPLAGAACNYTLYPGVTDCSQASGQTPVVAALQPGLGPVCVATGVYDGGEHVFASGMLLCA